MNKTIALYGCPPSSEDFQKKIGIKIDAKEGTIEMPCHRCGVSCLVGPDQVAHMKTTPGKIICFVCMLKAKDEIESVDIVPLAKDGHTYTETDDEGGFPA